MTTSQEWAERLGMSEPEMPQLLSLEIKYQKAKTLARDGCGWEDLVTKCGVSETVAKLIVFGKKP